MYYTPVSTALLLQNSCLSNAERCYSQARLVALQLSLLQSGKCVLNLDLRAVHKFMEEQPFTEVCAVLYTCTVAVVPLQILGHL